MAYTQVIPSRRMIAHAVKETTKDTLITPSSSVTALPLTDFPTFTQAGNYTDIKLIQASRTALNKVFNRMDAGSFSNLKVLEMTPAVKANATITGITVDNPTTITCSAGHSFEAGDVIKISGVTGSGDETNLNKYFVVATAPTSTTFTIALDSTGLVVGSVGTVSLVANSADNSSTILLESALGTYYDCTNCTATASGTTGNVITVTSHNFMVGDKVCMVGAVNTVEESLTVTAVTSTSVTVSGTIADATTGTLTLINKRFMPATEPPTFSLWVLLEGGTTANPERVVFAMKGCRVNNFTRSFTQEGALEWTFSGVFDRIYYGGTCQTDATVADGALAISLDVTKIPNGTGNADEIFFAGELIKVVDPDGTTTMSPTTISTVADDLVVPALSVTSGPFSSGDKVVPYLYEPSFTGNVIESRATKLYLATANSALNTGGLYATSKDAISVDLTVAQEVTGATTNEMQGTDYPTHNFIFGDRTVSGTATLKLRTDDVAYFESIRGTEEKAVGIKAGDSTVTGNQIEISMPKAFFEIPTMSFNQEASNNLSFAYMALKPTLGAEKEIVIRYF